jgi:hypothetical protein
VGQHQVHGRTFGTRLSPLQKPSPTGQQVCASGTSLALLVSGEDAWGSVRPNDPDVTVTKTDGQIRASKIKSALGPIDDDIGTPHDLPGVHINDFRTRTAVARAVARHYGAIAVSREQANGPGSGGPMRRPVTTPMTAVLSGVFSANSFPSVLDT